MKKTNFMLIKPLYDNVKRGDAFAFYSQNDVYHTPKKKIVIHVTKTQFQLNNGIKFRKKDGKPVGYAGASVLHRPKCEPWTEEHQAFATKRIADKKKRIDLALADIGKLTSNDLPAGFDTEIVEFAKRARKVSDSYIQRKTRN